MKKWLAMLLAATMLLPWAALAEDTPFDTTLKYHLPYHPALVIEAVPEALTMSFVPTVDEDQVHIMASMIVALYDYETNTEGRSADESMAAALYRGWARDYGIACMTAVSEDATVVNGLFAVNTGSFADAYWIEYNIADNTMRVACDMVIEKAANAEGFLSDYTFSNYLLNSVGGNPFISAGMPAGSVYGYYDASCMNAFVDDAYFALYQTNPDF